MEKCLSKKTKKKFFKFESMHLKMMLNPKNILKLKLYLQYLMKDPLCVCFQKNSMKQQSRPKSKQDSSSGGGGGGIGGNLGKIL